jgi:hypothetical protein
MDVRGRGQRLSWWVSPCQHHTSITPSAPGRSAPGPPPQRRSTTETTSAAAASESVRPGMGTVPAWPCSPVMVSQRRVWPAMAETTPRGWPVFSRTGPCEGSRRTHQMREGARWRGEWNRPFDLSIGASGLASHSHLLDVCLDVLRHLSRLERRCGHLLLRWVPEAALSHQDLRQRRWEERWKRGGRMRGRWAKK